MTDSIESQSTAAPDATATTAETNSGLTTTIAMCLLIAAHLPSAIPHYIRTWALEHYQFFPFALGMFAWLFHTRRTPGAERWSILAKLLLAADIVCLAAGAFKPSPWLVVLGLMFGLAAWCLASTERGYKRPLLYLALLPALTLRLPNEMDTQLIQWLQNRTTAFASGIGHRVNLVHYSEGNVLSVPGKTFLVAEACSGVNSLFTIMFIAALVICMKRRAPLHGSVLLVCGMATAGLMNVARVLSVIYVWGWKQIDLSTGVVHDILGYASLAVAAGILLSADAFLEVLSSPVPDFRRPGIISRYKNPLTYLWNMWIATIPEDAQFIPKPKASASRIIVVASGAVAVIAVAGQAFQFVIGRIQ
jgi:exosortase